MKTLVQIVLDEFLDQVPQMALAEYDEIGSPGAVKVAVFHWRLSMDQYSRLRILPRQVS